MLKYLLFAVTITAVLATVHETKLTKDDVNLELKTPGYPEVYNTSGSEPIVWQYESEPGTKIIMKCTDWRFTNSDNCEAVKVEIDTGDEQEITCTHADSFKAESSGNKLSVKLEGNDYGQAAISCFVKTTEAPATEDVDVKLNEITEFGSPYSMEQKVVPFFDKVWNLKAEEGYQIDLDCYVNLLDVQPCHDDVLTIDLGDGPLAYCGYNQKLVLFSKSNVATVRIELDNEAVGQVKCIAQAAIRKEIDIQDLARNRVNIEDSGELERSAPLKKTSCNCGWTNKPNARIILGEEASPNEYPWMVSLRAIFGNMMATCGGSIVTKRHVITAAHCLINLDGDRRPVRTTDLTVVAGVHNTRRRTPTQFYREYDVEQHFIRPEFPALLTHDFAIIVVSSDIEFNQAVGPICLSPKSIAEANKRITIMGWGKTELGQGSNVLLKARTDIVQPSQCRRIKAWEVCTRAQPSATCSGDSGGPLVWLDPETGRYTQVSLVSYGHPDCVSSPSVSTDVAHFYDWLMEKIQATYPREMVCTKV